MREKGVSLLRESGRGFSFRSGQVKRLVLQRVEEINTMAANNVKTSVEIPKFNRDNIHIYMNELKMWQFVTRVEKKKQGPLVWMSLPINDPSNIKQAINDIIGMDDLIKEDGMDKIIDLLKKTYISVVFEEEEGIYNLSQAEMLDEQQEHDEVMLVLAEIEAIKLEQQNMEDFEQGLIGEVENLDVAEKKGDDIFLNSKGDCMLVDNDDMVFKDVGGIYNEGGSRQVDVGGFTVGMNEEEQ